MEDADVVTCFVRNHGDVLLVRRADDAPTYPTQWGGVSGYVESDEPRHDAVREVREETGIDARMARRGEPFGVEDDELGTRFVVHPFLLGSPTRDVETNHEIEDYDWCSPTEILRRETVPELWRSYRAVAPTVETVCDDTEHGSSWLSARTLEVVRDTAAAEGIDAARRAADELVGARPSMVVVGNRMARAVADAATADDVEERAHAAVRETFAADRRAADEAAQLLDASKVVTVSRSGTVGETLRALEPDELTVLESVPGGEGTVFADELATALDAEVRTVPDSCAAYAVERGDGVVVGADAVLPDCSVVNKVGTRALALAAAEAGVPFVAVTSADKLSPTDGYDAEEVGWNGETVPRFERVPPRLVTVVTEEGELSEEDARSLSEEHARLRDALGNGD